MKYTFSFFVSGIAILCALNGHAQVAGDMFNPNDSTLPKPMFGFKLGVNEQTITGNDWVNGYSTGLMGGFYVGMHKNKISVCAEILGSTAHYKSKIAIDTAGNIGDFNIIAINIPLLFEYNFTPHFSIQIGPQYNSMVSVTKKSTLYADPKVLFTSGGFAGVIGLEVKLPQRFNVGARYMYGFTNLNNQVTTSTETWNNRSAQVYLGYSIR